MQQPIDLITAKLEASWTAFFLLLPNLVAAVIFLVSGWLLARLVRSVIKRLAVSHGRPDLGNLLSSMAHGATVILTVMFAAAIVFPSVNPAGIFATLGVGSVAIGFAFKDILQNLLAGLLLLITRPYRRGDQIKVKEFEGTIEHIESRATAIKTYDGRRVVIPNSDLYTSPVTVNTAFPVRRDEYLVGIGYGDNPGAVAKAFLAAVTAIEGVVANPGPDVLPWELGGSSVNLKVRWWVKSTRSDLVRTRALVIAAIFDVAKAQGVDLPFPTQVILFHDQTEDSDGDRARQREGWPTSSRAKSGSAEPSDAMPKIEPEAALSDPAPTDRSAGAPGPRSLP